MNRSATVAILFSLALVPGAAELAAAAEAGSRDAPAAKAAQTPEAATTVIDIAFLGREREFAPWVTNVRPLPAGEGLEGAKLGIGDNNTTGAFTKQTFKLAAEVVPPGADPLPAFTKLLADGHRFILLALPAADILRLADLPEAKNALLFNVAAPDDRLRNADCRSNVFHVIPNRAMLADALAQYLVKKKWTRWFLVSGREEEDRLYAEAVRRAAKKFGAKIVAEKSWTYDPVQVRRTAEAEIPVFTQGPNYEILIAADEAGNFGDELLYRTWDPRLVAGTNGLVAEAWHPAHDQWGATQMQRRFQKQAQRFMTSIDYAAWAAVRTIGEAATRTGSGDAAKIRDFILGPDFTVGVFKSGGASYRAWDHQLRMQILLAQPYSVVSVSPQPEFIHPVSNLDTLGFDQPESACKFK